MTSPTRSEGSDVAARRVSADLTPVVVMLGAMWVLEVVDTVLRNRLDRYGIRPRDAEGLVGIALAPFLHAGFGHLIANSVPFALLGGVIAIGALQRFVLVSLIVALVSGGGVWLLGADHSVHIGASGLVFGYLTYLLARGLFARNLLYILGGVVVFMMYGTVLWGVLPAPGISWQGHLFGAIGGVLAAYVLHADRDGGGGDGSAGSGRPRKSLIDRLSPPGY